VQLAQDRVVDGDLRVDEALLQKAVAGLRSRLAGDPLHSAFQNDRGIA